MSFSKSVKKTGFGFSIKRFLPLLMALTIISLLAACGGAKQPASSSEQQGGSTQSSQSTDLREKAAGFPDVDIAIKMVGADPGGGGVWDLIGGGVIQSVTAVIPDASITLVPGGGVANVATVGGASEPMLGLSHSNIALSGKEGIDPFSPDKKVPGIKAIASLYLPVYQLVVTDKTGITSIKQIKDEQIPIRIAMEDPGSTVELLGRRILEEYGITYEDIEKWGGKVYFEVGNDASSMIRDGVLDAYGAMGPVPTPYIAEVGLTHNIRILPIDEDVLEQLSQKYGYEKIVLSDSTYNFLEAPVETAAARNIIIANDAMPEDMAYVITGSLVENLEGLRSVHANLSTLTEEFMASGTGVPLHPGAEKYYREKGIIK